MSCPSFARTELAPGPGETPSRRAPSYPAHCCPSRRAAADVRAAPCGRRWGPSELAHVSAMKAAVWEAQAALTSPSSTGSSREHRGGFVLFFPFLFFFPFIFFPHLPVTTRTFHKPPPPPPPPALFLSDSFPSALAAGDVQLPTSRSSTLPPAGWSAAATPTMQPRRGNPGARDNEGLLNATK